MLKETAHVNIIEKVVGYAFMGQSAEKALGPNKINFQILRMILGWDKKLITHLVQHAI